MTPEQLAREVRTTPLQVRNYLRKNFSRPSEQKHRRWQITRGMADAVRWHFYSQEKHII